MTTQGKNLHVVVHPEEFKDHLREYLSKFIGNGDNFSSEDERKKAESIYLKLLQGECNWKNKLKQMGSEFKIPIKKPPANQTFNLATFSNTTGDNCLIKALCAKFNKSQDAAWEYMTLKQSNDSLTAAFPSESTGRPPRKDRFGEKPPGDNVTTIKVEGSKGKQQTPQAVVEPVDSLEDHLFRFHHHRFYGKFGSEFAHPEGDPLPPEPDDDSGRDTLRLLWTYQDFFEPKNLSKAQAEYNFYRNLERQWKITLNRVKLDDIKYPPFNMKDFSNVPRYRTLYAVIKFCNDSKDGTLAKMAQKAAEEYMKYTALEQHMAKEKLLSSVPQGIDLDVSQYREVCSEINGRYNKAVTDKVKPRELTQFKSMSLFDYLKMKETITSQRNQIDDLASKLSGIASQQLADGDPGFTDLGDKNRPQKLGERFAELFDETWSSAYESLKPKNPDADDDESDEGTMDTLQQIVKVIYDFCQKVAESQIDRLIKDMIPPIQNPVREQEGTAPSGQMKNKVEQTAREYRKVVAQATVTVLQEEIFEKEIKGKLLKEPVSAELRKYVDQCIELIWYMCIQQPPMEIRWAVAGEKFNREHFRFSGRKGKKYKLTVWPAVFLHEGGPLVAPGYAVPDK